MPWYDWMPLSLVAYQGKVVYHTYTKRLSGQRQGLVKYVFSTDTSADPNSEYAFDVRNLDIPLGLDFESPLDQMKIVACAIEAGKIKFPEGQLQKEVDLQDPKHVAERHLVQDLIAKEAKCKTNQRQLQMKLMKPKIKRNVTIAVTRSRIHQRI